MAASWDPDAPALVQSVESGQHCGQCVRNAAIVGQRENGEGQVQRWLVTQTYLETLQVVLRGIMRIC